MNRLILISTILLFVSFHQAIAQDEHKKNFQLQLNKGDSFTYTVESLKSFVIKPSSEDTLLVSTQTKSRHWFFVEEINLENEYVMRYKKMYSISENRRGDRINVTDSRFPSYDNTILNLIGSYLNTIEYKILFSPGANTISITNIEDIRMDLLGYLESKGQLSLENNNRAIDRYINEKRILQQIQYLVQ